MSNFGLSTLIQRFVGINLNFPILVVVTSPELRSSPPARLLQYQIVNGVGPNGNVPPDWVIAGPNTTLAAPSGVAVHGLQIYVSDFETNSITAFPLGKGGNLTPTSRIVGNNTALSYPGPIACDSFGNIFVAGLNQITVYQAGAQGNVAPIRTISGANTNLSYLRDIAVDSGGKVYALRSNGQLGCINIYPAGATGNIAPVATIEGPQTELGWGPQGLAVDTVGNIYVTNDVIFDPNSIVVYPPTANGNVAPSAIIGGPTTGLVIQQAITIGLGEKIYVVNGSSDTVVSVFPAGANGMIPPLASLTGSATLINQRASGIAVGYGWHPFVPRLFAALLGRPM